MSVTPIKPVPDPHPEGTLFRAVREAAMAGQVPLAVRIATLELVKQELVASALTEIHGGVAP